jgi:hypothetical protein
VHYAKEPILGQWNLRPTNTQQTKKNRQQRVH